MIPTSQRASNRVSRLNSFQKLTLQWNELHPYNAVHMVRIKDRLDQDSLKRAIQETLQSRELIALRLDTKKGSYSFSGERVNVEFTILDGYGTDWSGLSPIIEEHLNTPFALDVPFCPFRFFAVRGSDAFVFGLSYFHVIADAESIVHLAREIVHRYLALDETPVSRWEVPRLSEPRNFRNPLNLVRALGTFPSRLAGIRESVRPKVRDPEDLHNCCAFFALEAEDLVALIEASRSLNVTLNDLFLALLMKSLVPLTAGRADRRKRRKIALGCVVNIRRSLGISSGEEFGLFLGSFVVTHEVPKRIGLTDLARAIRLQTERIKNRKLYLDSAFEAVFASLMFSFFSTGRRKKFYPKHYPLWGGITNMNLNTLWPGQPGERAWDYCRAVSTGPATPLVLSITTVGNRVNIGMSYRTTVFSARDVEQIKRDFLGNIEQLRGKA